MQEAYSLLLFLVFVFIYAHVLCAILGRLLTRCEAQCVNHGTDRVEKRKEEKEDQRNRCIYGLLVRKTNKEKCGCQAYNVTNKRTSKIAQLAVQEHLVGQ